MDARLIENAQDPPLLQFKDKGIYMLTPKGLHILERFITKNGINGEHLLKVFSTQPICMKLLHLERRTHDDELLVNNMIVEVIFRRFVGRQPNYPSKSAMYGGTPNVPGVGAGASNSGRGSPIPFHDSNDPDENFDRTLGVEQMDVAERGKSGQLRVIKHTFSAVTALDWLVDYTTLAGRDEAGEIAAHFERLDLIELIADKPRSSKEANKPDVNIVVVRGDDVGGMVTEGQFRCHPKAIYGMTDRGREVARWEGYYRPPPAGADYVKGSRGRDSTDHLTSAGDSRSILDDDGRSVRSDHLRAAAPSIGKPSNHEAQSISDTDSTRLNSDFTSGSRPDLPEAALSYAGARDSNTNRLRQILEEPALRSLFREFLKRNFCEENLSFWLDVQDFKRRFHTTSSAVAVRPVGVEAKEKEKSMAGKVASKLRGGADSSSSNMTGFSAMEKHQQDLIAMAFVIYNTYLAPSSPCELNIEHNLRTELVNYVNKIVAEARGKPGSLGSPSPSEASIPRGAADLGLPADGTKATPTMPLEDRRATISMPKIPIHASQLQTMVRLYQRIQDHIFRLMATDSVPRFIKDARFLNLVRSVEEYTRALESGRVDPMLTSGPGEFAESSLELCGNADVFVPLAAVGQHVLDAMDLGNLRDALPNVS